MKDFSEIDDKDLVTRAISIASDDVWVRDELKNIDLGDKRRNERLIKTTEKLAKSPLSSINEACGNWADAKAAYRLFGNTEINSAMILAPHVIETGKRMSEVDGVVLAIQDTVFLSFTKHIKTLDLGPIGNTHYSPDKGLVMHNAAVFTTSGIGLGILSQEIWARQKSDEKLTKSQKVERARNTPVAEKESFKWIKALQNTVKNTPPGVRVVTVCDRESDFFDFIAEANQLKALYLVRARHDRKLQDDGPYDTMLEALVSTSPIGSIELAIPGNGSKKARTTTLDVRTTTVDIIPPARWKGAKDKTREPQSVNVVSATEANPPAGVTAVTWVLLTNLPIRCIDDAIEKIEWYAKRWSIEIWHKILKSGCKLEDCRLQTADRLKIFITLLSIIGWRLMFMTYVARLTPDAPATDTFTEEEVEALHVRVKKSLPPKDRVITVGEMIKMVTGLGGHLGRRSDGHGGATVLWRGIMRLYEGVEMMAAMKQAMKITL